MNVEDKLTKILNTAIDGNNIFGTVVAIDSTSLKWAGSSGNLYDNSRYFIASTTKIYISALLLKLRSQNLINIDDKISKYLPTEIMKNLHLYKGVNYSNGITIKNLMANTSGLPDYFQGKKDNGKSLMGELLSGNDYAWSFNDIINDTKKMKPKFVPGSKGKAFYSDTNYQLLGKIIEIVKGKNLSGSLDEMIFAQLDLLETYLYTDITDTRPAPLNFKNNKLLIPNAMSSFWADGGIVSTAEDSLKFIKAFFNGSIFPKEYLPELYVWNKIFYPLQYGVGLIRFKLPRIFTPFKSIPELIGHSGLSGAFTFYCPEREIYLAGTVNQINNPHSSYKLMVKLLTELL